jgi:hypothetical protein
MAGLGLKLGALTFVRMEGFRTEHVIEETHELIERSWVKLGKKYSTAGSVR